jgi:hypothetical protein
LCEDLRFWWFLCSWCSWGRGTRFAIPTFLENFGGWNSSYRSPMRCSNLPQSFSWIRGANQEIGGLDSWSWPWVEFFLSSPGVTGLTSASHRSNWCKPLWAFGSVELLF